MGCVSQDSHARKSLLRKEGNFDQKHAVEFSKGTWHQKNRERKGPSRGIIQKCELHERSLCAPRFEEVTRGNLAPRKMRPRSSMVLGEKNHKLNNADKATFYSPVEVKAMPAPTSKSPEEREFVVDFRASVHVLNE